MIRIRTLTGIAALLAASSASACELHAGMNFGVFGSMPAKINPHTLQVKQSVAPLHVTHQKEMAVEAGDDNTIQVRYSLPLEYRNIAIEFLPTDELVVLSNDRISPNRIKGTYALKFRANSPGEHEIKINIAAVKQGRPFSQQQSITITAI